MYLDNLSGIGKYSSPYWIGQSSASASAGKGANAVSSSNSSNGSPDQVSLSNAALALQAQNSASSSQSGAGSSNFAQEQQLLTTLADKSLAALGITSTADEAATQVSFDSLSYQVTSTATASFAEQGQQSSALLGSAQDATFAGEGTIVTPDGTQYTFQIALQLDQSGQIAATTGGDNSNAGAGTNAVNTATQQQPSNLLAQLVNAIGPSSATSNTPGAQAGQSATSSTGINWDAILKQTASLFDLLDSMATPPTTPIAPAS